MSRPNVSLTITGLDGLEQLIRGIQKRSTLMKCLRAATNAGTTVLIKDVRKRARSEIGRESGLLGKSVAKKTKTYPSGNVVGLVGVNRDTAGTYNGQNRVPHKYWHLVLKGTRPHAIGKGSRLKRKNSVEIQSGRMHPGAKGNDILAAAVNATMSSVRTSFRTKLRDVLETEIVRLRR